MNMHQTQIPNGITLTTVRRPWGGEHRLSVDYQWEGLHAAFYPRWEQRGRVVIKPFKGDARRAHERVCRWLKAKA